VTPTGGYPTDSLAVLSANVRSFATPVRAVKGSSGTGAELLVVSAFDAILSTELQGATPDPFPTRVLESRVVPEPGSAIRSLTLMPTAPAGSYALAYAITQGAAYQVTAQSESRWRATAVPLPDGNPLEVWAEGDRARIGFDDGAIFSLPNLFELAGPVPSGTVVDYAVWRDQVFALGSTGLYRLRLAPGATVATWEAMPELTQSLPLGGESPGFVGGRLHATSSELWGFTSFGVAVRISSAG
jgi:hypothetical protein